MTFGRLLKNLRERRGLGIKKLAPELQVNYTYLSKLENNKVSPSEAMVGRVATYFGYSKDEMMLAANRIPPDVLEILKRNPESAIEYLRKEYSKPRAQLNERELSTSTRTPTKY